jgi:hypothetical protein
MLPISCSVKFYKAGVVTRDRRIGSCFVLHTFCIQLLPPNHLVTLLHTYINKEPRNKKNIKNSSWFSHNKLSRSAFLMKKHTIPRFLANHINIWSPLLTYVHMLFVLHKPMFLCRVLWAKCCSIIDPFKLTKLVDFVRGMIKL